MPVRGSLSVKESAMLSEEYLVHGLNALSRAHAMDYFADGHRGAAIIAAWYLCREVEMEPGAPEIIRAMIDEHWSGTPLCAPLPKEEPAPDGVERIVETLGRNVDGLRQVGHNVIFPSLALRAFCELPAAATPTRVEGICRLIESFTLVDDIRLAPGDNIADMGSPSQAAEMILGELPRAIEAFEGRGQGWSGHLLTYGRALIDLRQMGHEALAGECEAGFRLYIKRVRMGPLGLDKPRPEHARSSLRPHERRYWERRHPGTVALGHVFKYPYGFYGLMDLARDTALKDECWRVACHVL
jgi:hypothetical protein